MTAQPEVVLDLEHRGGAFLLVLANTGSATAFTPRVAFDHPLRGLRGEVDLSSLPVWSGLAMLRPGVAIEVLLAGPGARRAMDPSRFAATVTWSTRDGQQVERRYEHDLAAYDGLPIPLL